MPKATPPSPDLPRFLTMEQTAARLGLSYQTVALFIQEGRLPAVDIASQPAKTRALYRIREDATVGPKLTGGSALGFPRPVRSSYRLASRAL